MPKLVIENGPDRGKRIVIDRDGRYVVGRDPAAQVPLRDEMISRQHFEIECRKGACTVRDLGSSNGTRLNGTQLEKPHRLRANDRIELGETIITYLDDEAQPLIGKEISGYRILDRIGRGGMGTVYRALQTSLDREVALKILAPHLTRNVNFVNLFIREARAAGALSHPNIVQVYDVGVQDDVYFFSMEFIPSGSVEEIVNREKRLPLGRALRIIRDAAQGLEYAESRGIIHRDIKPGNLMVGAGGVIKIGDLGIARSTGGESSVSQKDGVSGSPHYIAPEQAQGQDIDHRVDLYSLGISLYQMLAGRTPYSGSTPREVILKHIREDPPPLAELCPELPPEIPALVHRMIVKTRDQRVPSAGALLAELRPLLERYPEEGEGLPAARRWRRVRGPVLALLAAGAISLGAVVVFERHRDARLRTAQIEQEQRAHLDRAEQLIAADRLREAGTALTALQDSDLPATLRGRLDELLERAESRRQALSEEARQEAAHLALQALASRLSDPPTAEDAEILRSLARDRPDTTAATEALARARAIEQSLAARAAFESEAAEHVDELVRRASIHSGLEDYARAREWLLQFDERYRETAAATVQSEALRQLAEQVQERWQQVKAQAAELAQQSQRVEARELVDRFLERAGFPDVVAEARAELTRLDPREHAPEVPVASPEELGRQALLVALAQVWEQTRELGSALERAAEPLASSRLKRQLTAEQQQDRVLLERFVRDLPRRIASLQGAPLPPGHFTLESGGRTLVVRLTALDRERISYQELQGATARPGYALWHELSPDTRAELLRVVAQTPEQKLACGFLASINGQDAQGQRLMHEAAAADPELETLREVLGQYLGSTAR